MKFGEYDVHAHGLAHTLPADVLVQFVDAIAEGWIPKDEIILVFRDMNNNGAALYTWLSSTANPDDYM